MFNVSLDTYVECDQPAYSNDAALAALTDAALAALTNDTTITHDVRALRGPGGGNAYVRYSSPDRAALEAFVLKNWNDPYLLTLIEPA